MCCSLCCYSPYSSLLPAPASSPSLLPHSPFPFSFSPEGLESHASKVQFESMSFLERASHGCLVLKAVKKLMKNINEKVLKVFLNVGATATIPLSPCCRSVMPLSRGARGTQCGISPWLRGIIPTAWMKQAGGGTGAPSVPHDLRQVCEGRTGVGCPTAPGAQRLAREGFFSPVK